MLSREERLKQNQEALAKRIQSDAAYIRQVEAEREKREKIDQYKAYQQARVEQANRNNQAIQYAREAAREEFNTNLPEYREQERERWKATTQAWREAENARKYYDTRSAETNAREKQRRANAMKDYTALQAQRDNYEYKKNVERAPYQYARQVGYDRDEIRSLDQKYTSLNQRAADLEYEAQKALNNDIPKMQNVMDTEKKYGTQDSARAIAGMIETGGAFDPKKNYSGAGKESQAQLIAKTVYLSAIGGVPDPTGRLSFNTDYMTDSEKAVILKMAYAGDLDQLYQYANDLIPVLDAREYDAKQQQISQMSRPMQVAYGMTGTIASPLAYAQMGIDTLRGGYTDLNSGAVAATRLAQEARTKSLENASPVGQFMGNVAYSMADNLVSMSLGQTGALIWLGLSAAGNEGVNALENGATQKQAFAKATASGLIETATEKMGIDNLFDIAKKAGSRGIKSMLLDIAKQAGSEGTEEIISEFANAFADAAIMGQESDFNKAVRAYEAENMSHDEALRKATLEFFVKNPAMAGLAGAVSGALFGVGGVAVQQRNQIRADRAAGQQITNRENVGGSFEDVVLSEGMNSSDNRIRQMAYNLDAIRNENQSNKTREYTEGFKWSAKQQRQIGEIYDSLDPTAKARVDTEASNRRAEEEAREAQRIEEGAAQREAELTAEQRQQTIAEQEAETDRLVAEAEGIDLDSADVLAEEEPAEQPETRAQSAQTEAEEMDRLASIAEEATRTGDTSVLDRANQTEQTATQTKTAPTDEKTQRRAFKKQVRDILTQHGITNETSVIDIADEMQAYYKAAETGLDSAEADKAARAFFAAAQSSLENDMLTARSEEIAQKLSESVPEENRAVRDFLRGKYYWPKGQSVPGYDSILEFNRAHFGGIQLTNNRDAANLRRLDQVQAEFAQNYPGLAGGDMYNDSDILEHFTGVYDSMIGNGNIDAQVQQRVAQEADVIRGEAMRGAMALNNSVVQSVAAAQQQAAQPAQQTQEAQQKQAAPTTSPDEAGRQTANNARKAGLSAEDTLAMSNVARQLGVNLEFRKMRIENINGAYNRETNTILLNQNLSTAEMAWTVFAHEITHAAETAGAYEQVRDIAKRHAAQFVAEGQAEEAWNATIDELRRDYAKNGVKLDRGGGEFEAVANIMQEILGSREAMEGVAQYSREDAQALLASINNVLDRTTENDTAVTPESARLVQAQKTLAAALSEMKGQHGGNVQYSMSERFNPNEQDIRYSVAGVNMDDVIRRAIERYGLMPAGEQLVDENGNPVTRKNTDVPNKASANTRSRSFYRTAAESNNVALDVKTRALLDQYIPTSNEKNVEAGKAKRAEYSNFDQAYGAWKELIRKGRFSSGKMSEDIAFGEQLLLEAQKVGDGEAAINILSDIAMFGTEAGQAIQALSILKRLSPEGQLMNYKRVAQIYAQKVQKQGGKVPADVQTAMDTIEVNEDLLNKLEELERLKKLEANGGKMTESEAQKIAELEKEIEKLNEKLKPMLDKLAKLKAERHEDAMEAGKLKRQEKTLPRQIEATQKEIDEIQKVIDELNEKLEPKRIELQNKLAEESLAKEQRDKLRKELSEVNEDIRKARDKINRARASILHAMAEMSVKKMKLQDMQQYIKALRTSKEIINIYLRYVQNKGGGVVIPSDLQTAFLNAKTDEERDAVRKKMDIAIADQLPGTWSEKIRGWRYISMLFNPTTHERNILGNVTQYGLKGMRDTIATGMERIFLKPGEERTKAIASRISKADRAYYDAAQADYKIIEDDLQAGGRESETAGIDNARKIYKSKVLEAMRRFSGGLLESEDKVFLRANYTQSYAEYLKANKIDPANMTDDQKTRVRQIAFQQALEATYRDASTLATWMSNLEKQGAGWEFAMGGIMPFKKTPINVLKRGVEYSPAGLIKATYDMVQATRGRNAKTKADIIGEYASGITGTMLSALGLVLARAGVAFATPSDDDKDRKAAIDKETGMQNYAIKFKLGGKEWTYTFDWLAPASMAFFAGVRSFEAFRNKEKMSLQGMLDGLISTVNPVFELSMLDGLADMFRSYASSGSGAAASVMWSILESYALQFFPTFGSKLARVIDPFQRSTYTAKDAFPTKDLQRLYRRILAKIPGATYALEPVTDSHGNLKENIGGNILGRIAYNFASPGYLKEITREEIDEESKRVYADTGKTEALPKEVPTSVDMNGETFYLDAHEYRLWGERMGKEADAGIDALIQTDAYKNANAVQQSKMIADIREDAYEHAKIAYFDDLGIADEYYTKGAQSNIEKLLYDDSQGYREYKNIPAVRELYESGALDPKTVYDAALTLSHIKKDAEKLDALNNMEGLNQDEYSFLYMTKIADDNMMADIQATLDAGGDLYKAVSVASQYYKWDDNAVDEKTGEAGKWVSVDKGTKAGILAASDLSDSAKEAFYLNKIVSENNVEKEQAKIADYYDRKLTINDYLNTLGIKYDDEGTAYKNSGGLYRELLASGYSDAVKEAAVCNIVKNTESSSEKAEADIAVYKAAKLTVNDYLAANAAMYGSDGNALKTVREKAIGLRDSGMSDKAKTVAWYTTVSDAKAAEENIKTFLSDGNTVDQFLTAVSATSVDGMKQYQKAAAIMQMHLNSYTAAMKSVVTGSENAAKSIDESLAQRIPDKLVAAAYTEYVRINADESTYGNAKAQQFAKWLEENSSMKTLTKDQRNFMRDNFSFYIQIKASAGTYNNLMSYTGMSSKAADSISTALSSLKPLPGAKGVSTVQKFTAIADDRNSTDNEKDIAMYNLLDTDDDEADSKALKYYKLARSHGVSVAQYADFRTKNATLTADKDKNGKSISGSKREKQLKLIDSYPISAAAKDDLYRAAGLGESTLKKAPWH